MCGGTIEFEEGATVGVCDSCGTKQTLPRLDDDKKANLYDRANHFRRNNDFDKAMTIYEQILNEDNTDAEVYWSLVLCRYGIEYVEDPASHKRIPTVNRAQFTSIFADEDYKSALQYADAHQKTIYEDEAKAIDDIQKGILAISQKEEPFDVFICYKETDEQGRRTQDSVLANDLYHQLTAEGFKVFFSRITLEDKLGTAYEPYIFAALNSAKVMVALGTKPEYFNAVWVKNEWSRYLALVKNSGGKKMLIPAYRDMDPYDLPEEFSHLQAQDMSKLGFMQDLIRGIKKIIEADAPKQAVKETVIAGANNAATAPLLERVFLFLEDGKWQDANIYCEKVLDIDPKNAMAYLGKLMAELKASNRKKLADCAEPFDGRDNYSKVLRFGDETLEAEMRGYITHINERNENARKTSIYDSAKGIMQKAQSETTYKQAAEAFESIPGFKDADKLAEECRQKVEALRLKEEQCEEELRKISALIKEAQDLIEQNEKKLSEASLFAISEKKEIKNKISELNEWVEQKNKKKAKILSALSLKDQLKFVTATGAVYFGEYSGAIEWQVLKKTEDKALLISKYALDCQKYNTKYDKITWETCSLRKWLNGEFLDNAFSADEQALIATTTVSADKNPNCSTNPGNATTDKVFLLSITEAEKYFTSDSARQCKPTKYAVANGAYVNSVNGNCWWWLRSPGYYQDYAADVRYDGSVFCSGRGVINVLDCVRPALWINLES